MAGSQMGSGGPAGERAGSLLRGYRRAAGLSQRQLAGAGGVSVGVVRDLEQGRTGRLAARSVAALAAALGLDADRAREFAVAARGTPRPAAVGRPGRVRLGVLGPLAAWRDDAGVELGPPSQRAVLGLLALSPGELVRRETLIDAWWGDDPPRSAARQVQVRVSRLRQILDPGRAGGGAEVLLASAGAGYRLEVGAGQLDLLEFRDLAGRGDAARRAGQAAVACGLYERALELWRGDPLADIAALRAHPAVTGLSRQRAEVIVAYAESACELGWYERALPAVRALAEREPLDEAAHAVLIIALAGTGRQAAALEVFQDLRRRLDEQLGVRPGAALAAAHLRVLRADLPPPCPAAPVPAPAPAAVRYSLPPDTAAFTGREDELTRITATAAQAAGPGGVIAIQAIGGMPGVGKTALAVRAAHLLAGRFPDRQLFVSLHGHTPGRDPVAPADALAGLLAAAGADPRYLPEDLDGRAGMWRDKMAGQQALLVLDNAASSGQVAALLPGGAGWLVLVTSRRHLGDLPGTVTPLSLDVLPPQQAADMFTRLAPRAAASPGQVAQVAALAGFLPLAISLLARVFARHSSWTLAGLISEIGAGVLTLTAEDASIAAAFDLSYRHLDPGQQRFFRLLGLHPGIVIDSYAAAALAGTSPEQAAGLLDGLHAEGLLTETGHRRYGMHDLLRRYARDHADRATEGEGALERLLDYYQHAAARAEALLARQARPGPPPATPAALKSPELRDAGQALAWARAERASLLACLDHVTRAGQHVRVVVLTAALTELFRRDGPWADAITRHATAVRAARRCGDRAGEAGALRSLGEVRWLADEYPGAARDLEQALGIYRDLGDRAGEAGALHSLGEVRRMTDDYPGAARGLEQALGIFRDLGDRLGEAGALRHLGAVRRLTNEYPDAAQALEQALVIFRDLGDRLGEANALMLLGDVRRLTGDFPGAARDLEQALGIFRDLGDRLGEASALTNLGAARRLTGDFPDAAQALEQALGIFRDLGDRLGEANALMLLGAVRRLTGDFPDAAQALEQALGIFRDLGSRGGEAEALNEAGTLHRARGDLARAEGCHQQALELARAIASPWDEAHALAGLGRCATAARHATQAQALLRQAQQIFQRIGAAEARTVLAELNALTRPQPPG
jgi:DNA-binding SARP family transcriptional activator